MSTESIHSSLYISRYKHGLSPASTLRRSLIKFQGVCKAHSLKASAQGIPERRTHLNSFQPTAKITAYENGLDCPYFLFSSLSPFLFSQPREIGYTEEEKEPISLGGENTTTHEACLWGVHGVKCRHQIITHHSTAVVFIIQLFPGHSFTKQTNICIFVDEMKAEGAISEDR